MTLGTALPATAESTLTPRCCRAPAAGGVDHTPLWLICIPTLTQDGRPGTHTFAVRGATLQEALGAARVKAADLRCLAHRRGARLDSGRASAVLHH